jgi:hypothetical protein
VRQVGSGLFSLSVLAVNTLNVLHAITDKNHWISRNLVNKKPQPVPSSRRLPFPIEQ